MSGRSPVCMICASEGFGTTVRLGAGPGRLSWKGSKPALSAVEPPNGKTAAPGAAGGSPRRGTSPLHPANRAANSTALSLLSPGTGASRSALQQGRERLVELLDRRRPRHPLAVDEKCRRRADAEV